MMATGNGQLDYRLSSGGVFHWLRQRTRGIVTDASDRSSVCRQFALGVVLLWLPLVVLTGLSGSFAGSRFDEPLLLDMVPHVRFLIALPLLLVADLLIDPAIAQVIHQLRTSGVVPESSQARFEAALARLSKQRDSVLPDLVMLVLALVISWQFQPGYGDSAIATQHITWLWSVAENEVRLSPAGWWYLLVSAPIFQFVLFRWLWRFLIWTCFLSRVSRLRLSLQPTHSDLTGGLGLLDTAQQTFTVLFLAFATVMASTLAHNIIYEGVKFHDSRPEVILFVALCTGVIVAPLLFFSKALYVARCQGLRDYGKLGYRLSVAFSRKWLDQPEKGVGADLLASTDPSAAADYGAVFDNVSNMRIIPTTPRSVLTIALIIATPFAPLYFTEVSITEVLQHMADSLI